MKTRLDVLMVQRGLAESREKAKAVIMSGNVFVDGQREDKAGASFGEKSVIEVKGKPLKYVSRGGLKLEKAMEHFDVSLTDRVCMDVGTNQLAWKLRQDSRVVVMERTNIRYVTKEQIPEPVEFASIDVAFISLTKVLGPVKELLTQDGDVVALIKPQFEAGREQVGKKGVVRDRKVHLEVIRRVMDHAQSIGFAAQELEFSPIRGPEGNIEYLLHLKNQEEGAVLRENVPDPAAVVEQAHEAL